MGTIGFFRRRRLTHNDGGDLGDLAHVVVGLHDALYPGDGEVHGDVHVGGGALFPLHGLAPRLLGGQGHWHGH